MSRAEDIAFLEGEIAKYQQQLRDIQQAYQKYASDVAQQVRDILVEAGVYEEVHALEMAREKARASAQEKANRIVALLNQRRAALDFLLSRGVEDEAPSAPEPEAEPQPEVEEPVSSKSDFQDLQESLPFARPGQVVSELELIQKQVDENRAKKSDLKSKKTKKRRLPPPPFVD